MAYDSGLIVRRIDEFLERSPRLRLAEAARRLGMDRHTIARALAASGRQYRTMQRDAILAAVRRWAEQNPPRSAKLLAHEIGFSSRVALSHYLRRHAPKRQQMRPDVILTRRNSG